MIRKTRKTLKKLDSDEETFKDKLKRKAGIFALIGSGILSVVHVLSHLVPALAVLGFLFGSKYEFLYNIVSNEYMQFAFLPFVFLGFWYMYRDHKHHQHERELRTKLSKAQEELKKLKRRK